MGLGYIDKYVERRIKNISQYSNILLEHVYIKDEENKAVLESSIYKYINDFEINDGSVDDIIKNNIEFFERNKITSILQRRFLITLLEVITKREKVLSDNKFIDNLYLFSEILTIAYELNDLTTSFVECDVGYKNAISEIRTTHKSFTNEKLDHNIRLTNTKLKKKVTDNARDSNDLVKQQLANPFYLEFYKMNINGRAPNFALEVNLKNGMRELEKYDCSMIEEICLQKQLAIKLVETTIEMAGMKILEMMVRRKKYELYVIRLPSGFVKSKVNRQMIIRLTKLESVRKKICFEIDYDELKNNSNSILEIKNSGYKIAMEKTRSPREPNDQFEQLIDCVIVDSRFAKEFAENNMADYEGKLLLERDVGLKDVILEL